MKKIVLSCFLIALIIAANAQTENGIVYSEHPTIETSKELLKALVDGDEDKYVSFFAGSVYRTMNSETTLVPKVTLKGIVKYWSAFDNLEIKDTKPAYPDAIEYKDGGTLVQDWVLTTATHQKTAINVKEIFHHIYRFNDEGKIIRELVY